MNGYGEAAIKTLMVNGEIGLGEDCGVGGKMEEIIQRAYLYCMKCRKDTHHILIKGEYLWYWCCKECKTLK